MEELKKDGRSRGFGFSTKSWFGKWPWKLSMGRTDDRPVGTEADSNRPLFSPSPRPECWSTAALAKLIAA